ncbi:MAG: hypothetical protein M1838_004926 [Thelocarpon superellum]|nr:MAG: hypothetical protein M1838_004926 [Thelocarpon superellum]
MVYIVPAAPRPSANAHLPPTKEIPRRPSLSGRVRTRDEAEMDELLDMTAPTPGKRAKVSFDPQVRVQTVGQWEKGLDLIREEVRRSLERHRQGDNAGYDGIKEIFSTDPFDGNAPSPATVKNHLLALTGNVSLLDRSCSGLIHAVLSTAWLGRDDGFVTLYVRWLGNLVSAQGTHVGVVLGMLVRQFTTVSTNAGHLPAYPPVRPLQRYNRIHMALKYLLQLIPAASSILSPVLTARFPPAEDTRKVHTVYVRNLLRLIGYAPELKSDVMALITDRLLKIDVQVQVDLEDLEDEVGEVLAQDVVPPLDASHELAGRESEEDEAESDVESAASDESVDPERLRMKEVTSNVRKIDAIMDLLFAFYAPAYRDPSHPDGLNAFRILLNHFASIILPTYRSRHTQFLLFHFAQTSPLLMDEFVGACAHLAFEEGRPAIMKQSAAAYLASFIARGAHVPAQIVQDVFYVLGDHLDLIRTREEGACTGPDMRRYGTFYAMVQALLYIFCFRWRDLVARPDDDSDHEDAVLVDGNDIAWAPRTKEILTRNIYSKLNPLKICAPSIVNEFARIAHHVRFMYIFPILETNKRLRLTHSTSAIAPGVGYSGPERETALTARKEESYQQLDAYFPFDPYHLPVSKRWIEGDYVEWRGIPGLDRARAAADSESDEEAEMDSEDEEDDTGTEVESD